MVRVTQYSQTEIDTSFAQWQMLCPVDSCAREAPVVADLERLPPPRRRQEIVLQLARRRPAWSVETTEMRPLFHLPLHPIQRVRPLDSDAGTCGCATGLRLSK